MNRGEDLIEIRRAGKRPDVPIVLIGDRRLSERYEQQGFYVVDWRTMVRPYLPALRALSVWICHTPDRTEEARRLVMLVLAEDPLNLMIVPHGEWRPWSPLEGQVLIAAGLPVAIIEEREREALRVRFKWTLDVLTKTYSEQDHQTLRRWAWNHVNPDWARL